MATFTFDGSASQTIAFNATVDRAVIDLDVTEVASFFEDRDNDTVTIVATSGAVLTLTNTNFAAIAANANSLVGGLDSDIVFGIGTDAGTTVPGNVVAALDGTDTLSGTTGDDLLFGNQGNDTFTGTTGSDRLFGGQGNDGFVVVTDTTGASDQTSSVVGGLGTDSIAVAGTLAGATFTAGGTAYAGSATLYGGNEAGDPTDTADNIGASLAETGSAVVYGNGGADNITVAGTGDATVYGGQGADVVIATVNSGLIVGGLAGDTLTVTTVGTDASVTVYGGNEAGDPTDAADTIGVTAAADSTAVIYGNGGGDTINISSSTDAAFTIYGGQGNDSVNGAGGAAVGDGSVVYGGLGFDTITLAVSGTGSSVQVFGGNGDADAADGADAITVTLATAPAAGVVPAIAQEAVIYGNGGDDLIDVVGAGNATVFGGAGADVIDIGNGAAATGIFALTGGVGADVFDLASLTFDPLTDTAADVSSVTDLTFGTDTIDFGTNVTLTADLTDATGATATAISSAASLSAAAEAAFDAAFATSVAGDAAVVFTYVGQDYLAFGANVVAAGVEVDGYINVTGFTGTIGNSSFI